MSQEIHSLSQKSVIDLTFNDLEQRTIRDIRTAQKSHQAATIPVDHLWTTGIQKSAINDDSSRWMGRGAFRYDFEELAAEK